MVMVVHSFKRFNPNGQIITMKLSTEDRDDLFKYTRYFALKASQLIVSSRSGQKDSTPCRKKSDWFNLNISDIPGLLLAAKKNISNKINYGCPVCVEIFLQTSEGDKMVLETWCICLLPEHSDPSPKITHTVYNQMGILLKSLVSVTRVIPAYKLSQRQGPDSYTIFFRMYEKEPEVHALGEGCKQVRIGQICTPVGTLQLSVAYRVKMTITPTQSSSRECSMLVKSDHFNTNLCPRFNRNQPG
ncbi:hypothetical protein HHI36_020135 [Cryptolaemus montrouzieri]|uniref:Autophagy-related protein 13 n=1 Tax=Cryptolaemus montrouzieri TaxID=559131 RepID=A0ABD2N9A7_9CUCU